MRKVAKALAWVVASVIALAVVVYLAALVVNWHDEPPSAAARRFTERYAALPAVADEDNAYVYLMGLHAAAGEDPNEAGRRRLAVLRASRDWRSDPAPPETTVYPLKAQAFRSSCTDDEPECVTSFAVATALLEEWTAAQPLVLPRYQELLTYRAWRDEFPNDISLPLPSYAETLDGQRLLLLRAYSLAERGEAAEIAMLLASDLRFWRSVFESSDMLITKMIALAALRHHFEWGNLVLRRLDAGAAGAAIPGEWHVAFTDTERSMVRTMTSEWLYVSSGLSSAESDYLSSTESWVDRVPTRVIAPLYQPQDTINRVAEHYWALSQEFEAPLAEYPAALERASALTVAVADNAFARAFYNPLGNVILSEASDFTQYAARVADIEGVRRAALAAATLRAAFTAPADVPAALAASDLRSPYDDGPLVWDSTAQAIVFDGLETGDRGEHRIYY
jgi:hypothetical protein